MLFGFKKINIEAPFKTAQVGFEGQGELISEFKDHLFARMFCFKDENNFIIHFSLDVLAFDKKAHDYLEEELRKAFDDETLNVISSATHTHYSHNVRDTKYKDYLLATLILEAKNIELKEYNDLKVSYEHIPCKKIGKSRISDYETDNEILGLIRVFNNDDNLLNIVYLNCHPTILASDKTKFFTSEYPGLLLKKLEDNYHSNFTFLQGAAGDISSRFVRRGQDYKELNRLVKELYEDVALLMNKEVNTKALKVNYLKKNIVAQYENKELDLSNIRKDLSERELITIDQGIRQRKLLNEGKNMIFGELEKEISINILDLNIMKLVFFPNEIFSEYLNYLNIDEALLVSYSNGYGPYVLPIDFKYLTYEMFMDTMSSKTKHEIIDTLVSI